MVLAVDDQRVAKIDTGSLRSIEDIETEREAYRKLSNPGSPYVLRCYEPNNPNGIVLERCIHTIRKRLQSHCNGKKPPEDLVKNWVYEAVQGLAYVHRCGVIQGDGQNHIHVLSCRKLTCDSWMPQYALKSKERHRQTCRLFWFFGRWIGLGCGLRVLE
jgi:hypothetical protein